MIGQCLATFCSFLANFSLSYVWLTSSKLIFNFVFVSFSSRSMVPVLINHQHQCEQLSKTKLPFGGKYIFCFTSRLLLLKKPFPQTHPSVTLSFISYYPSLFLLFCILLLLCFFSLRLLWLCLYAFIYRRRFAVFSAVFRSSPLLNILFLFASFVRAPYECLFL